MPISPRNCFTYHDLVAQGLSLNEIDAQTRVGLLLRIRRGVYSRNDTLDAREAHRRLMLATMQFVEPSNVFTHESAAVLHGLPLPTVPTSTVFMTRRTTGHADRRSSLRVRNTVLSSDETTHIDALPVTTLARTTVDLARLLPYEWGVAVCDAALRLGLTRAELADGVGRHHRLRGLPRARMAAQFADGRAESPAESISRVQLDLAGLPAPELQYEVYDDDGVFVARADFGWPELRLVGEVDGKWKYGELLKPGQRPEDAIMREKNREENIRQSGHWVVRWDVGTLGRPGELAERVSRAMAIQQRTMRAA